MSACGCGSSTDRENAGYNRPIQLRYGFTVTNETSQQANGVCLRTFVPLSRTATQKRIGIKASHPYQETKDGQGRQALVFTLGDMAPYASRVVTIRTDLMLAEKPVTTKRGSNASFVLPEVFIESDHPRIAGLADRLRQDGGTATARKVFGWVADNLTCTGYRKHPLGALGALEQRQGDCTEFMHLFVALCRANHIPARGIGGFICRKNTVLKPGGYHNWAEFHDGRTWRIADPQSRIFMSDAVSYIAMHFAGDPDGSGLRPFHLYQVAGKGVSARMNAF